MAWSCMLSMAQVSVSQCTLPPNQGDLPTMLQDTLTMLDLILLFDPSLMKNLVAPYAWLPLFHGTGI